jgi:hypothetical protein
MELMELADVAHQGPPARRDDGAHRGH